MTEKIAIAMIIATLFIAMPLYIPIGCKKQNLRGALCVVGTILEWLIVWYVSLMFLW